MRYSYPLRIPINMARMAAFSLYTLKFLYCGFSCESCAAIMAPFRRQYSCLTLYETICGPLEVVHSMVQVAPLHLQPTAWIKYQEGNQSQQVHMGWTGPLINYFSVPLHSHPHAPNACVSIVQGNCQSRLPMALKNGGNSQRSREPIIHCSLPTNKAEWRIYASVN